jgi:amidohydrolase
MSNLDEARKLQDKLVAWRRDFHRHPELGLENPRTAGIVAEALRKLGFALREGLAQTGVVGVLENGEGPVIMVRADMDALPVEEAADVPYASEEPGRMHACGHDAHTAIGLGVATLMAETRDTWQGTLKMVFQPGEEGQNGAGIMVEEGALEDPRPDKALALHVWSDQHTGEVSVTPGPVMAAAEAWEATLTGKGGHAAAPEQTVDPVVTAALTIGALQTIVSRNVGARETVVVTVGSVQSGDAFNVIPDDALLKGTVRTYDEEVRETVSRRVREVIEGTAATMGAKAEVRFHSIAPAVVNDPQVTEMVQEVVRDTLGDEALNTDFRTMGSEDAAFFFQEVPGCYFFLGSTPPGRDPVPHHNPGFIVDEEVLPIGVSVMVAALRRLMPAEES